MNHKSDILKYNLTIWLTIILISTLVKCILKRELLFNSDWAYISYATLIGILIYSLITKNLIVLIIKKFKIKNKKNIDNLIDIIKWTTIYTIKNIIYTYLKYDKVTFNKDFFKLSGGILLGFILFNIFIKKYIPASNLGTYRIIKFSIGLFLGYTIRDGTISSELIYNLIGYIIALIIYFKIIIKFIPEFLL